MHGQPKHSPADGCEVISRRATFVFRCRSGRQRSQRDQQPFCPVDRQGIGFVQPVKGRRALDSQGMEQQDYKRLKDALPSIVRLRDQAKHLGAKLSTCVWQLPATFGADVPRLDGFLRALRAWPEVRHALELRHRSWFVPAVADRLREAGVSVCLSDAPDFPMWREVTSGLVYVRLHGHTRKYASQYSAASLARWAADTRRWLAEGRDVHVYFDNDGEGHAVHDALMLRALVDGSPVPARPRAVRSGHPISGSSRAAPWRPRSASPRAPSVHLPGRAERWASGPVPRGAPVVASLPRSWRCASGAPS
jgi:uncharacterized protein YecE (DUF72 family)